ncbi:galactosyl transferase gma12 mnn10 family protein [Niveomyces insectorum RCEF 264]|uniref:Galactosyl transferase gma12 mnn10 family protein n=1 Tax=Niveomyces insectorum RCEF 264 TaxID=1081102 RepID=A0A167ZCC3_9HYPO|nr:galactosyl transferase gma12 mnn10 family protein [Niveomyces insectorum RCEF 264]
MDGASRIRSGSSNSNSSSRSRRKQHPRPPPSMLVQQFQRPTRLLAVLTAACLVYLCFNFLQRVDFAASCNALRLGDYPGAADRTYEGEFGVTRMLSARPAMVPKGPQARVAKVGVAVNALDIPVVHRAFKTHQYHNELHGYPHYIADREVVSDLIENDRMKRGNGAYTKPAYLLAIVIAELLKPESERLEWLFWFDGDTMILNPSTPLETFLPPNTSAVLNDVHLVISSNWDGLNSGAFALRVHPWTASLLSGVLAYPMYEKERTLRDRFRDQSAFQFLLTHNESPLARDARKHRHHWAEVPMRWFNSLPVNNAFYANGKWLFSKNMTAAQFDNGTTDVFDDGRDGKIQPWKVMQGDLLVHFAGTKGVRDSWMTPWLERAEALLPEWNNVNRTRELVGEVAAYWHTYEEKSMETLAAMKVAADRDKARKLEEERKRFEEKKKSEERKKIEQEKKKEEQRKKEEEKERLAAEKAKKKEEEDAAKAKAAEASKAAEAAKAAATTTTTTATTAHDGETKEDKPVEDGKSDGRSDGNAAADQPSSGSGETGASSNADASTTSDEGKPQA